MEMVGWMKSLYQLAEGIDAMVRQVVLIVDAARWRVGDENIQVAPMLDAVFEQ